MSGLNYKQKSHFDTDHQFILDKLNQINTIVIGTILEVEGETATVSIYNTFPKITSLGESTYTAYPNIKTNFFTLSLYQYVPTIGDKVILFVFQSDISGFLNDTPALKFQTKFNLYDSLLLPISLGYDNASAITAGKSALDFDINCSNFNVTTLGHADFQLNGFKVQNSTGSLIPILTTVLTAIGNVAIPGGTIDSASGGALTVAVTKLDTFNV